MISKNVTVNLPADAEARPVAVLVQIASQFDSKVYIGLEDKKINAKSIMGMMSLGLTQGAVLTVSAEGDDAQQAVDALSEYLEQGK